MNTEEIIATATLSIIILGHLCTTVWWMSKVTANLENMTKDFQRLANAIIKLEAEQFNKNEALREMGRLEAISTKAHSRLDFMNETVLPKLREDILRIVRDNNHRGG